jgi:DNA topoisomerase II
VQEIKVAQLSGYVAEKSAYHHGEQSLATTIVGMAQNFVGSNNINYLEPKGQFGTRGMGGKDAASARYIYTRLTSIVKCIFHKHDRFLLNYLNEEGQSIEPEYYIPVIPTVLINGAEGIGTGWSTFIPCFNPVEIIQAIKDRMEGKQFERLNPWYKHYNGDIEYDRNTFLVTGKFVHDLEEKCLKITELPIRKWTRDYKKFLETLLEKDIITDLREYHTTINVDFEIFYEDAKNYFDDDETIVKQFKLSTTLSDNNYVLFDRNNKLKRYADETEILDEFYDLRYELYVKRKNYLIRKLQRDLEIIENKVRFIKEVNSGDIVVNNKPKKELLKILRERKYSKFSDIMNKVPEENKQQSEIKLSDDEQDDIKPEEGEEDEIVDLASDYNYLLSQAIWSLTKERIKSLEAEMISKEQEIVELRKVSELDLWRRDLDEILVELEKVESHELKMMEKNNEKMEKAKKKAKPKNKKKANNSGKDVSMLKIKEDPQKSEKGLKRPPKKDRTKKWKNDVPKSSDIAALIKKKGNETTASEHSEPTVNMEDLSLIERMRLKKKMREENEKKSGYDPDADKEIDRVYQKKKVIDDDEDEEEITFEHAIKMNTRQKEPVNYREELISDDSESSFEI